MILIKFGQYVNEMMAVAVKNFQNFLWSRFLIIRQNVNLATNAIPYCGLSPNVCPLHMTLPLTYIIYYIGQWRLPTRDATHLGGEFASTTQLAI